jgi:hypothetical protein
MFALYPKDMQPMSEPYDGPEKGWHRNHSHFSEFEVDHYLES